MYLIPTDEHEIDTIIKELMNKSSTGYDKISNNM